METLESEGRMDNSRTKESKRIWQRGLTVGMVAGAGAILLNRSLRIAESQRWKKKMGPANGRMALVTGASSGIGAVYAQRLAELGYDLTLVARRENRLNALAADLREHCLVRAEALVADLSIEEGIAKLENRLAQGDVDFLVNNAGYDVLGFFSRIPAAATQGVINCHLLASVRACRAVLPGMIARRRGVIVNVSSTSAFAPTPGQVTYSAVKAYLNMFSEALQMEVAGKGIRVQVLCPGFTRTEFHKSPQYAAYDLEKNIPAFLWMTPQEVVEASLRGVAEGVVIVIPGMVNKLLSLVMRSGLPTLLTRLAVNLAGERLDMEKYLPGGEGAQSPAEGRGSRPGEKPAEA